ncbi:peroxide stress protein YaaA [Desulfosediminicola flagellatus]|uniref:peroxide stress protein YaaA n=1 Tax=Desulfosediminicola flagellatus TaxID=2569541 RepID=UPI00142EB8F4|nr:peroxide stress protein YaaA [Desulfosediminicola flagellatus]
MLLITAPSKTQQPIDRKFSTYTLPVFINEADQLNTLLNEYSVEELCTLMKMSEKLGESTRNRILEFRPPLTETNSSQAIFTFQGDAYSHLTPDHYSETELYHAQRHVRILSGLYGILRPLDRMFPYRLEMGARLATREWKNLYEFWGNTITEQLNLDCSQLADQTIVNLASAEYSKAIRPQILIPSFLTITFKEKKGDSYKTIPIHSKRARGMMIHYVITTGLTRAMELRDFTTGGYSFSEKLSTENEWIFIRNNE